LLLPLGILSFLKTREGGFRLCRREFYSPGILTGMKIKAKSKKSSPGQMCFPWGEWEATNPEIAAVAETFVQANSYYPTSVLGIGKLESS